MISSVRLKQLLYKKEIHNDLYVACLFENTDGELIKSKIYARDFPIPFLNYLINCKLDCIEGVRTTTGKPTINILPFNNQSRQVNASICNTIFEKSKLALDDIPWHQQWINKNAAEQQVIKDVKAHLEKSFEIDNEDHKEEKK
tara:strand:+ start:17 stop:445 length:429 start_codon:yes stop_codon:yes gene_type:complete